MAAFGALGAPLPPPDPCSIGGSLSGADAASNIDGAVQTVTVPAGNSGKLRFESQSGILLGLLVRVNGGSLQDIATPGTTITWTNGQTAQLRASGQTSGAASVDIYDDDTNTFLQTATLTRL